MSLRKGPRELALLWMAAAGCARAPAVRPLPAAPADFPRPEVRVRLGRHGQLLLNPDVILEFRRRAVPDSVPIVCPMPVATGNRAVPMPTARPDPAATVRMPVDSTGCRNPLYDPRRPRR